MKTKQLLLVILVSMLSAMGGMYLYGKIAFKNSNNTVGETTSGKLPANYASFLEGGNSTNMTDFSKASETSIPAVVHIKTKIKQKQISNDLPNNKNRRGGSMDDMLEEFFGNPFGGGSFGPQVIPEQKASGSGVIISQDGYIVTNNHVISDGGEGVADEIKVTLNEGKKTYTAKVVGKDPSTDLAVLKIDATGLPYLIYGNSDDVKLGQWVLAVGYPLSLEATVTAGIVSAKGRAIGINERQSASPVESFIQTDAAVNPGNSGGPLINTAGQLIGINSAILAPNGTYAGYSFAIPVNLVKKIVNDIIEYGDVKRGYLGIQYSRTPEENDAYLKKANVANGVYVSALPADGGAAKAGIKKGDIITKINGKQIFNIREIPGYVAVAKPGDKINVAYIRNGKEYTTSVTLTDKTKPVQLSSAEILADKFGIQVKDLDKASAEKLRVDGGVVVTSIDPSGIFGKVRIEKGFTIIGVNRHAVKNVDGLISAIGNSRSSTIEIQGMYPGDRTIYSFEVDLSNDSSDSN
ncbi:MAG: PDZ domain-containing protein [Chitinophagaceae bacterium]|nr:MAG: PDZ domain-containing protein [Chitinophagaceae bacterium]